MTFVGRLKQTSEIHKRWRGEHRTGGAIKSVQFSWEPGNIYRTMPLTTEQIELLQGHDGIVLEVVSVDLPVEPPAVVRAEKPLATAPPQVNNTSARRR